MSDLKRNIRRIICDLFGEEKIDEHMNKVKQADVISVDLYDTLVCRCCRFPEDIFFIVEDFYNRTYKTNISFAKIRCKAEEIARKKKKGEVTLSEIYDCISGIPEEHLSELRQLEINAEIDFTIPDNNMSSFLNDSIAQGKKVIIISDMYLPKDVICKIVEKCGISDVSSVYVSCEYNATKRDGEMFDIVLNQLRILPARVLHIGDHFLSDYINPQKKGISAIMYKRANINKAGVRSLWKYSDNNLCSNILINTSINSLCCSDLNYLVGNRVLGSILLGYCIWLHDYVKENHIQNVIFLSREGHIIKKAFDILFSDDKELRTTYINVSRLSVCRGCAYKAGSFDGLVNTFTRLMKGVETAEDFVRLVAGDDGKTNEFRQFGRLDALTSESKENLFIQIVKIYGDFFVEQNKLLKEYLYNNGFDQNVVAISDIGWSGSMQMHLKELLPDVRIIGNYLAVSSINNEKEYCELQRRGYYCDSNEWSDKGQTIRFTQSAIETLFMSTEGTTIQYEKKDGIIFPIKSANSWNAKSIRALLDVQRGAMDFIKLCYRVRINHWLGKLESSDCMSAYTRFAVYPNRITKDFFSQFNFIDGINDAAFVPKHKLFHYLFKWDDLQKELETNNSKVIWLYSLLELRLPYYRFLVFLAKQAGVESSYSKRYLKNRNDVKRHP